MKITMNEFTRLVTENPPIDGVRSVATTYVNAYGLDGILLDESDGNKWAIDLVKQWRAQETKGDLRP